MEARIPCHKGLSPKDTCVPTADPEDQDELQKASQMDSDDDFDVDINERWAHGPEKPDLRTGRTLILASNKGGRDLRTAR